MPALTLAPAFSFLAAFQRVTPVVPIRTFLRTTSGKLRPSQPRPFKPLFRRAQEAVIDAGTASADQLSTLLHEPRNGPTATIVLGGFVPASTEQVFLLRNKLLKSGTLYYFNYAKDGFSLDLMCAQLDDLVEEATTRHGRAPVIFSVSFGCGIVLEWLRRARRIQREPKVSGLVFVSPVACVEDLLTPGEAKPSTLLGRAVQPFLDPVQSMNASTIDKARAIFLRMFEAGAQNKDSLRLLLTRSELTHLRDRVMDTIREITPRGARERVQAMTFMPSLLATGADASPRPLSNAPTLVLYAEKEGAVIPESSPTRKVLAQRNVYFPQSYCNIISNPKGSPVQHASLIFHGFNFQPVITAFYRTLKARDFRAAA